MPTRVKGGGNWLTTVYGVLVCLCGHAVTSHDIVRFDLLDDRVVYVLDECSDPDCGCDTFQTAPAPAGPDALEVA